MQKATAIKRIIPDLNGPKFSFENGLFGINTEVTRKGFYGGICAQMLNNRKLYAGEDSVDGWDCNGAIRVTDHPRDSLCDSNYVILNDGTMRQKSELIALRKGKQYEAKAWVKALSAEVTVTLGVSSHEKTFELVSDDFKYKELSFTFDGEDADNETFYINVFGEAAVFEASLLPTDYFYGMRRDVIEALRELSPAAVRFPGGCYADHFEWRESLKAPQFRKPVDGRSKAFMLRDTYHQDCVEIGLNEFIMLCREIGAEPEYTVSHLQSDGEDARCLIEYCNGGADTEYGAIREALGFAPFDIKVWYIGNESYYFGGPYRFDGGLAAERTNEIVKSMMTVDPDIKAVIGLVSDKHLQPWSKAFMERLDCPYGYVSYHWYYGTGPTAESDGAAACERLKHTYLHDTDEGLEFYKNELFSAVWDKVKICVDEWNFCWGSGSNNALLLSNAYQMHFFAHNAEKYHIREARFFMPINEGMITVNGADCKTDSSGVLFKLMQNHKNGNVCACTADAALDVLCTEHEGELYMSVINRDEAPCEISVQGYEITSSYQIAVRDFSFNSDEYDLIKDEKTIYGNSVIFMNLKKIKGV